MAPSSELQLEDQTDEDFFDKLVGDDGFPGSGPSRSAPGDVARALSGLSIGDASASAGRFGAEDRHESGKVLVSETHGKEGLAVDESAAVAQCDGVPLGEAAQSSVAVETVADVWSPGSSTGKKSVGSKAASVKQVQWSSFSSGQGLLDVGGYSSFFGEVPDVSTNQPVVGADTKDAIADINTYFGSFETEYPPYSSHSISSEQLDVQANGVHNEEATAGNGQYWEKSFPGWMYDASTGQWYQVESYDNVTDLQVGGYGPATINSQEAVHVSSPSVDAATVHGRILQVSHSQQTAPSAVEAVTECSTTGGASNWNQDSYGNTEYPPNMVFDPQYPGWFYNTNTLEWFPLESYMQTLQATSNITHKQQTQDVHASSDGLSSEQKHTHCDNVVSQSKNQTIDSQSTQQHGDWGGPEGNQTKGSFYGTPNHEENFVDQQMEFPTTEAVPNPLYGGNVGSNPFAAFMPAETIYQFSQPKTEEICHANVSQNSYLNHNMVNYSQQLSQSQSTSYSQFSYTPNGGGSLEGRPPHALVTFGFGGKLIVIKDATSFGTDLTCGDQNATRRQVSVLNLAEVVLENTDSSSTGNHNCDYFHTLCKQSFPGPLVGGNAGNKDLNKWIDERITSCGSSTMDFSKGELLRTLFSLLKISWQHYGKLRSPFSASSSLQETDGPELAVTELFASARKIGDHFRGNGSFNHCMHNLPSEGQIQSIAFEVQNLLVSGRRKEALQCAREGQLWGPALILAAQLGGKFYVDTVKQMAHQQFVSGSPLQTLCFLIAGQPEDVFSMSTSDNGANGVINMSQQPMQASANGVVDNWEENLAIITANRTKDDELVIIHLGDCLWKERGKITAAHTCYLVAEVNFELYSDKARMCLIGADHWKFPRTYASPEAIQRTEFYEYSKVLGNSQFILMPFQPYKVVYAYMLAEVGKIQDSMKYCQAMLKLLKNAGRISETETLKVLVSSLEERLRMHQQGGDGTNLAPTKLVGKLFNSIDRSLQRMIGAPPQSLSPVPPSNLLSDEHDNLIVASKIGNSQSTKTMPSLVSSTSVQTIREWTGDGRRTMHNRSISEPDFGRSSKQEQENPSKDDSSTYVSKTSRAPLHFGLFGSSLFQKTVGWVSKSRQAKLGESNKFYYDEKLKRWVEEGAEPPADEAALPPPPTTAPFQNGMPECNINKESVTKNLLSNGIPGAKTSNSIEHGPGIPPTQSQNQFSARGRMGVRSRYVDTFNRGVVLKNSFESPFVPSATPVGGAKLFTPTPVPSSQLPADNTHIPSMNNISAIKNNGTGVPSQNGNGTLSTHSRTASWNGS